ncbi:spore cortex biosynthesis protein YabQ [Haloplasma contractile SSD-17B]|uniref:Spore cortex biosynthesis protein YabQ n=2 Tax=Haloplasma TaxID=471824 RepID=U2FHZ1_9MOLU|nr:spore cortex biosynthesis protein YabQ [Haloplasma contractile]ERJ12435.1 spore cortex biosynthesis protein YabQ [Haloplasma contractile SSD-17B]
MNLIEQYRVFISSLLIGVYLGVTYDLLFHFVSSKLNKIIRSIIDVLFFVIQALVVFRFMYKINHAIIPLYTYFLFMFGFLIYHYFADDYYKKRIEPLQYLVKKIFMMIKKSLYWGFIEPYMTIYTMLKKRFIKFKSWFIKKRVKHKIKKKERKKKRAKKKEEKKIKKKQKKEEVLLKKKKRREQKLNKKEKKRQIKMQKKNKLGDGDAKKQFQTDQSW